MRVLLINHYYWPDISANAQYGTQLAEDLAASGMDVHAVASRGDYLGRGGLLAVRERRNGVSIVRVRSTNFGKRSTAGRLIDAVTFHLAILLVALRLPKPDVILTQTAPMLVVVPAACAARLRGSKFIVWCQDVWPDLAFALGILKERSLFGRVLRSFSYGSMRKADKVLAIGRCMQRHLSSKAGLSADRIVCRPNWGDSHALYPLAHAENTFRARLDLGESFVVMYSGNMGWGHPFESIMQAALLLREERAIRFIFIGEGRHRRYVEDFIGRNGLSNAALLPYQPYERLSESLSAADLHLISLDERLDGLLVPSKLYGVLAVGRPVLFIGSEANEIAYVIEESGCGRIVSPRDPGRIASIIRDAAAEPGPWCEMGKRSLEAFRNRFTREMVTEEYRKIIRDAAAR